MATNKVYTAVLALIFFMGAFLFPQAAYGYAGGSTPPDEAPAALSPQTQEAQTLSSDSGSSASADSALPSAGTGSAVTGPAAGPQTQTGTQTAESAIPDGGGAFTPDGAGTVLDHAADADGKEFYTISSESGAVYYLIIDRQRTDGGAYFLNAVTEADLLALAGDADAGGTGTAVQEEDPAPEPAKTPEPEPEPEPEKGSGTGAGTAVFLVIAAAAAGGAAYYIKILRPKRRAEAEPGDDELWDEDIADDGGDACDADGYLPEGGDGIPREDKDEDTAEIY